MPAPALPPSGPGWQRWPHRLELAASGAGLSLSEVGAAARVAAAAAPDSGQHDSPTADHSSQSHDLRPANRGLLRPAEGGGDGGEARWSDAASPAALGAPGGGASAALVGFESGGSAGGS